MREPLIVLAFTGVAAIAAAGGAATPSLGTAAASSAAMAEDKRGELLYRDDFSDPESGWEREHEAEWVKEYLGGTYRIVNVEPSQVTHAMLAGREAADADVSVTARKASGEDTIRIGLIFRATGDAFLEAAMRPAGQCSLRVVNNEPGAPRRRVEFVPCPAARVGDQPNRLRVVVAGRTAVFFVNDARVAEITDVNVGKGRFGLLASSTDAPSDVRFDDFEVRRPSSSP